MGQRLCVAVTVGVLALSPGAHALDGEWLGVRYKLKNHLTAGFGLRMEARDYNLVSKTSVPGQQMLCAADDCQSSSGDPAPNQRLVDAKGAFSGVNGDDGNWNYERWHFTEAPIKLTPQLTLLTEDFRFVFSGLAVYDPVNANFDETHGDTRYQPQKVRRPSNIVHDYAKYAELREAYGQTVQNIFDRDVTFKVGRQTLPWGEALLVLFHSLNQLNSLDGVVVSTPGFQLGELSLPVGMAVVAVPATDNLGIEVVAPFEWRALRGPPHGSFASTTDALGNDYLMLGLGNTNDDPYRLSHPAGDTGNLFSQSSRTISLDSRGHKASNTGQYGLRINYLEEAIGSGGTEFGLYFLNYHSQFPYASGYAADESCMRDSTTFAQATVDCNGFQGASSPPGGQDPFPVATARLFLEYPENIQMYGISFNSNLGLVALSGEWSYRPNMPMQVHTSDVVFAMLQPALPRQDIMVTNTATIPAAHHALPSYLTDYRGLNVQANQYIAGYERMPLHNVSISGLSVLPQEWVPFAADEALAVLELGATYVQNMPDVHVLPLNTGGDNTHPSPGADGTGDPNGTQDTLRQNPTQQTWGLATALSYGYRGLFRLTYNSLIPNTVSEFTMLLFHDLHGYTPAPQTNFIQGRIMANLGATFRIGNDYQIGATYEARLGGNDRTYLERDRDRLVVFAAYDF